MNMETIIAIAPLPVFLGVLATIGGMPRCRYTKNGGMRFLRIGRLQMSWCVCRTSI